LKKAVDLFKRAEAAAKREGNETVEGVTRKVLAEKTQEGRINVLNTELLWSVSNQAPLMGVRELKAAWDLVSQISNPSRKSSGPARSLVGPAPALEVQLVLTDAAVNPSVTGNLVYVEGRYRNVSAETLNFVLIVVIFEDSAGKLVTTEEAISEPPIVSSGGIATFKATARSDPRFDHFKLSFSSSGKPLDWRDATGKGLHQ
jgi:hypothetical protein